MIREKLNSKNNEASVAEFKLKYGHLIPAVAEAMRQMFDPAYHLAKLFKDKAFVRWMFQLIIAIEIIEISGGKRKSPNDELLKFIRGRRKKDGSYDTDRLSNLAYLLYTDEKNKLRKAIFENKDLPLLSSKQIIKLIFRTIRYEGLAREDRLDSDSVKMKGGVKKAKPIYADQAFEQEDGSSLTKEMASETFEDFKNKIYKSELWQYIKKDMSKYVIEANRPDRAKNIMRVLRYYFEHQDDKVLLTQMHKDLGISLKSISKIVSSIRKNSELKALLSVLLRNPA